MISSNKNAPRPIGVFDSGLGGLTVVRQIRRLLPAEDIVYFGDLARLPYGIKSQRQVVEFSKQNASFLLEKGVKALVVACNTSASASLSVLKKIYSAPVVDVIVPTVREACRRTKTGRIGVIGTQATVASGAYERAIRKIKKNVSVFSRVCPLFVPLVEEGRTRGPIAQAVAKTYLKELSKRRIDVLILGCTHYPLLRGVIQKSIGRKVKLIDSAPSATRRLIDELAKEGLLARGRPFDSAQGRLRIFVTDRPRNFVSVGERFLGHRMDSVRLVKI